MNEQYPDIATALSQLSSRSADYRLYRNYVDGDHRLLFATEKFLSAFGALFRAFSDNLCSKVVDAAADRLILTGFSSETGDAESISKTAWALWLANRMDLRAAEVHTEALTSGDAYVIVWPDASGQPIIYPNDAAMMTVHYDCETPGSIMWASKCWSGDGGKMRLNLYYSDRIEKYITTKDCSSGMPTNSNGFVPFECDEAWPLLNPYGRVPVFHFANRGKIGAFGRSELCSVIPLQDALNKTVADTLVGMEFMALPQRWATGLETPTDELTGKPKALFIPGADRVWASAGENTKFGQFDAANISQLLAAQDTFRKEIATVSSTPIHFLQPPSGNWPSGEALKTAESEFLAKIGRKQVSLGNNWEDVMSFALRVAGAGEDVRLSAIWKSPAPHSEIDEANTAVLKKQVGISDAQLQREMGYTETEIVAMAAEKQTADAALADVALASFDRGGTAPQ